MKKVIEKVKKESIPIQVSHANDNVQENFSRGTFLKGVFTKGTFHNEGFPSGKFSDKEFSGGE